MVDHRSGDTFDNRRRNLRIVTSAQNAQNRQRVCARSGFRGVSRMRGKWQARVGVGRKIYHLGTFVTKKEAAAAAFAGRRLLMTHSQECAA